MINWETESWHWCQTGACLIAWSDHWQTMITGALAVGAAGFAAWLARGQLDAARRQIAVARDQITATETAAARDRDGRLRAARASLPATLSSICGYAEQVARELMALMEAYPTSKGGQTVKITRFPIEALSTLGRIIELTDDNAVADRIESILRESQVLDARTPDVNSDADSDKEWLAWAAICIEQAAAIRATAESLFSYARRETTTAKECDLWDGVFRAYQIFGVYENTHADVIETARRPRKRMR